MGVIETIILSLAFGGSVAYNIKQSEQIGELTSDRDQFKVIAEGCSHDVKRERINEIDAVNRRSSSELSTEQANAEYNKQLSSILQVDSVDCIRSDAGNLDDGILDAKGRRLEKLREAWRLQP